MKAQTIWVIAAHADDEVLGCGGTICRHRREGDEVSVLFLTDGVGARRPEDGGAAAQRRAAATKRALAELGVEDFACLDLPDNALDTVPLLEVVRAIAVFGEGRSLPDVIYTHHGGDLNVDHQIALRAVLTRFRPQPGEPGPEQILSFEVPSSTGWFGSSSASAFVPNLYSDISMTWEAKRHALEAYAEEMRPWPHARSLAGVEHLARLRGATVGVDAAEAFVVERIVR